MKKRNAGLPLEIQEIAWKAQKRLHVRYMRMTARGKSTQCTVVAGARELAGFVWAIDQKVARKNPKNTRSAESTRMADDSRHTQEGNSRSVWLSRRLVAHART